jgi:hypothetical protein
MTKWSCAWEEPRFFSRVILWVACALILSLRHGAASSMTHINATGGNFPLSLYQQASFFYETANPTESVLYDGSKSIVARCNIMGYWSLRNKQQLLGGNFGSLPASLTTAAVPTASGTLVTPQTIEDYKCTDQCTPMNGCGFDSCLTPKPDKAYREPLGNRSFSNLFTCPVS